MKALASTSPKLAIVKVMGRAARKYYGLKCHTEFVTRKHDMDKRSVARLWQRRYKYARRADSIL